MEENNSGLQCDRLTTDLSIGWRWPEHSPEPKQWSQHGFNSGHNGKDIELVSQHLFADAQIRMKCVSVAGTNSAAKSCGNHVQKVKRRELPLLGLDQEKLETSTKGAVTKNTTHMGITA
jgi:hypothetical protein